MKFIKSITLKYRKRTKELLFIAVPVIMEQIFITLMGVVNMVMASRLGAYVLSAIGMIDSISNLIIALFAALTTGGTIIIAQCVGKKDLEKAKVAATQALLLAAIFSMIIFAFLFIFTEQMISTLYSDADEDVAYAAKVYMQIIIFSYPVLAILQTLLGVMRGSGDTKIPMFITIVMNIFNVLLSFILIFGINFGFIQIPSFGIAGAATALLLSRIIGLAIAAYYVVFVSKVIRLNKWSYFKPNISVQKVIFGLGFPASVEGTLFQVGKLVTQIFIVGMGTAAIAAQSVSNSILGMINVPGTAFATGVMILVGQRIGRGDIDDVIPTSKFSIAFGSLLISVLCLFFFLTTNIIVSVYNLDEQTTVYFKQIHYLGLAFSPFFWSLSFITPAALRATGDVKYTMVVAIASMWLFRIVFGYVFGIMMGLGIAGVWIGMIIDWVVRSIFMYTRLIRGKWREKKVNI